MASAIPPQIRGSSHFFFLLWDIYCWHLAHIINSRIAHCEIACWHPTCFISTTFFCLYFHSPKVHCYRESAKRRTGKGYLGVVILNGVSLAKGGLFHRHYGLEHERHPRRRLHTPPNRWAPRRHVSDAVCNHCFACMFRIIALFFFLFGRRAFCGVCNMYLFFPPRPLRPPPL